MNTLERALIEKAGCEHGWENILESHETVVVLASARHRAHVRISADSSNLGWTIEVPEGLVHQELARSLPECVWKDRGIVARDIDGLAQILRRTAELAKSLPNQAALTYQAAVARELKYSTEVERLVRQRVGQDTFRQALMNYWRGACAVTGIDVPEVLRASHAKPWAECKDDEERLDVFNGFLLSANLDALFDQGLITIADNGVLLCSFKLENSQRAMLKIENCLSVRWLAPEHLPYIAWHRKNVFRMSE